METSPLKQVLGVIISPLLLSFHFNISSLRRYISSHGASIHKTKVFLEKEGSRLKERQAALQAAQTSSSEDPNQDSGLMEEILRNLQQVWRKAMWNDFLLDCFFLSVKFSFLSCLSGGQTCGGAAADSSERKHSAEEEGGAAPAAGELLS